MKWLNFLILLLLIPCVSAEVVLNKILYDPIGSETNGEAIEIINLGEEIIDITNWTIKTPTSETDATLPHNILMPGERFLLADEGWNTSKDNSTWRNADYEEKITLRNTDGGVAIKDKNGNVADSVSWGAEGFGEQTQKVSAGKCLVKGEETFEEGDCDFILGETVEIETGIENLDVWILNHEVFPGEKVIVKGSKAGNIIFKNITLELIENNGTFTAEIETTGLEAGIHYIDAGEQRINFTVLEKKYVRIKQKKLLLNPKDELELTNLGSVNLQIIIQGQNLKNGKTEISKEKLYVDEQSLEQNYIFELKAGEMKKLMIELKDTQAMGSGTYKAELTITYDS